MAEQRAREVEASRIMLDFAARTGVAPEGTPRRYLWTDAFAVANLLGLARVTRDEQFVSLALALISQVHHVLGRYRADDPRKGWLSELTGEEAESHPTRGGLRIGKDLPERKPREPFDERFEWARDGQYFLSHAERSSAVSVPPVGARFSCAIGGNARFAVRLELPSKKRLAREVPPPRLSEETPCPSSTDT